MPIKFRCQQCRQFLGISRARAGEVVDCPTCGRTIRVPELDGTVKPLPKPSLSFDDSRLQNALDEIASIGEESSQQQRPTDDDSDSDSDAGSAAAQKPGRSSRGGVMTLDEPQAIELPPLPSPEPVAIGPLPRRAIDYSAAAGDEALSDESIEADRPWRSTAQPGDSWRRLIAAAALKEIEDPKAGAEAASAGVSSDCVERPGSAGEVEDSASPHRPDDAAVDRESALPEFSTWFAIIGLIALICSVGFWIGRTTAISWSGEATTSTDNDVASASVSPEVAEDTLASGIAGRITWKSEAGQWSPDRDACVIVLPVERDGVSHVSFVGLRRDDSAEDRQIVSSSLQAMGGAVGFADEHGRFEIALQEPGEYHVLILSRSVGRPETADDAATLEILSRYFDRSEQLLGQLAYRFETIRFTSGSVVPLDAGFGPHN